MILTDKEYEITKSWRDHFQNEALILQIQLDAVRSHVETLNGEMKKWENRSEQEKERLRITAEALTQAIEEDCENEGLSLEHGH